MILNKIFLVLNSGIVLAYLMIPLLSLGTLSGRDWGIVALNAFAAFLGAFNIRYHRG